MAPESRDAVDAATACSRCLNTHAYVLLIRRPWCEHPAVLAPPPPALFTADPEE